VQRADCPDQGSLLDDLLDTDIAAMEAELKSVRIVVGIAWRG
jgi:hypothetical protein